MTTPSRRRLLSAGRAWWDQSLYVTGYRRVRELDLDTHALALCAQQVLCTAPLIVAMSAVLQRFNGRGISLIMTHFFGLSGQSADEVARLFGRSSPSISTWALLFALATAVVFSTSVGAVQQRAFELIWTLPRVSGVRCYTRQLIWALGLGVFTLAVLFAGRIGREINANVLNTGPWSSVILQGVLTFGFYWWSQHWLLGGRVGWWSLWPGAFGVGVGTTVLVRVSRYFVPAQIEWQARAYGLIGGVFVLSVWLMILSAVIFGGVLLGALIVQRRMERRGGDPGLLAESPLTLGGLQSASDEHLRAVSEEDLPVAPLR
ncbi:hypothetical protein [uncultured Jatrophihabitans sp.]|uniref:hypothetical protein n=1 Tax=uncultured Jatrophihabitans sp. TaxID=1610747 RepID=UPI0035CAE499